MRYNFNDQALPNKVEDLFCEYNVGAKPFLKWVGGKRQLLGQFEKLYPQQLKEKKIVNYYEPFVGGGAVFFDIAQRFEISNAYLYDINEELILAYTVIQRDVSKLLEIATIKRADFKALKNDLNGKPSFIYFDPPYKPISKTSNFTSYSK